MRPRKLDRKAKKFFHALKWPICLLGVSCHLWAVDGEDLKEIQQSYKEPVLVERSELAEDLESLASLEHEAMENELIALSPEWSKVKIGWASSKEPPPPAPLASRTAPHFGLDLDVLYFEPIQTGLKYAQTNSMSFSPPGENIDQPFTYRVGCRVSVNFPFQYENWAINFVYTYFHPKMPSVHKVDSNQFLYMILTTSYFPQVNNFYNVQCGEVKGSWQMKMDVLNAEFKKTWLIDRSFVIKPFMGVQAASIKQRLVVHYKNLWIINGSINGVPTVNPQKLVSNLDVYGIGPDLGSEFHFIIPSNFSIFCKGLFSCMFGKFQSTTKGTENLGSLGTIGVGPGIITTPYPQDQILKNEVSGAFTMMQLQAALSKQWKMGKKGSALIMLGWETQYWWSLFLRNGFNEPDLTSAGADLSVQGPFFRLEGNF